jgi:hypothetical protein
MKETGITESVREGEKRDGWKEEEVRVKAAAQVLVREWDKPEWCERYNSKLEDLVLQVAQEFQVPKHLLLRTAMEADDCVGRHYVRIPPFS